MRHLRALLVASIVASAAGGLRADTVSIPIGPDLDALGWKHLVFDGIPETRFTGSEDGVLRVAADHSSSVLYRAAGDDPVDATTLSWTWRATEGLAATDLSKKGGDDRVLALFVAFKGTTLFDAIRGLISPLKQGKVLTYVWGGAERDAFPHPYMDGAGWIVVRQPADTPAGTWIMEQADLKADYERAFGEPAPAVAAIGVSGDADDLKTTASGEIKDIRLE